MNISTGGASAAETTTQTQQTATDVQASSNADKVSNAPKKEEIKDEGSKDTQNDFKKFLKSRKDTDKISIEQPQQINNLNQMINGEYAKQIWFLILSRE